MGQFLLTVPYETSPTDPDSYAGARVLRMILLSVGVTPLPVDQMYSHAAAYDDPGEPVPFWYIDPGAMQRTLLDFYPQGDWALYEHPGQPAADNQVQETLVTYGVATANLVNGGKHWVCVAGYTYDNSNNLTGFIINDPAYTGGGANQVVALSLWDSAFNAVAGGIKWLNQIIEVGDPRPVQNPIGRAARLIARTEGTIIGPDEAVQLAVDGALAQFGDLPNLRRAIDEGRPGRPQLVARMDSAGSYYYVVPLQVEDGERHDEHREGGQVIGTIMVDARFGDVLSASATEDPFSLWPVRREDVREIVTRYPIPIYDRVDAATGRLVDAILASGQGAIGNAPLTAQPGGLSLRETVAAALGSFAIPRDYVVLRPGEFEIDPIWVWGPCGGISPFHPWYVVRTPWQDLYVNANSGVIRVNFDFCLWNRLGA
jgi:hypothetical protein